MNPVPGPDPVPPAADVPPAAAAQAAPPGVVAAPEATGSAGAGLSAGMWPWVAAAAVLLAVLAGGAVALAWNTQQRVKALETELVRRQQDSATQATEARALARQASDVAREAGVRVALVEARLAETALQRTQLDDLIQNLARSRDDSLLLEIEAALRVAMQQTAITGSVQPLVVALAQAEERLARHSLPRMEQVKRAVARDLQAARSAAGADLSLLALRLDEAMRGVDELPLVVQASRRSMFAADPEAPAADTSATQGEEGWRAWLAQHWRSLTGVVAQEARDLVRVSRIDRPEALLLSPEQAYFLRENLKLRLLNARLALLARQFDAVQSDLAEAQAALKRWFQHDARRVVQMRETLQQVSAQAQRAELPRPDATLAAIATLSASR